MISNLIIISLLAVDHVFTEERATTYETLPLASSTSNIQIIAASSTSAAKEKNTSPNIPIDYIQESPNRDRKEDLPESNRQVRYSVDDINYDPHVKYETANHHVSSGKNAEDSMWQEQKAQESLKEEAPDKSKELDIDNDRVDSDVDEATKSTSKSFNPIHFNLLPANTAGTLHFNYTAEPINATDNSYKRAFEGPSPSLESSTDRSNMIANENGGNGGIDNNKIADRGVFQTRSDSNYGNYNSNTDNAISTPENVSKSTFYPIPEEQSNRYSHTFRLSPDRQINIQIIKDNPGPYEQDLSPTRQLDDYQEEIEKLHSFDGPKMKSEEAASRKFLKYFKEKITIPLPLQRENMSWTESKSIQPESLLHTYVVSSEPNKITLCTADNKEEIQWKGCHFRSDSSYPGHNITKGPPMSQPVENQEMSSLHTNIFFSVPRFPIGTNAKKHSNTFYDGPTLVEIQKSVNMRDKMITESNGDEIYRKPPTFHDQSQPPGSLTKHPIRVNQAEEDPQGETNVDKEDITQLRQEEENLDNRVNLIEKLVPYPVHVDRPVPQPYPVERVVERYVDRPIHVERIVEKQLNVPYPVKEVVEKIIDRPVPVEKIVEKLVHVPYPVQFDRYIDRPYAVQVPVAVAIPVPLHRYINRPYPVEKIIEKPIHVPYPVERIVEKIVEKHVPVEVERIVQKPIENVVEKNLDFLELVPPPLATTVSGDGYKTLPEHIDYLILNDYGGKIPYAYTYHHLNQPVKRSPDFGRNVRLEYGFKPPLVPSLEISDQGRLKGSAKDS